MVLGIVWLSTHLEKLRELLRRNLLELLVLRLLRLLMDM
jgi:hypothetical protein